MPDVGDLATARLDVSPHDGTTSATLLVTGPAGQLSTPVVTPVDDGAAWTAPVVYTAAGVWRLSWTVTGTGASEQHQLVSVAPTPGALGDGRVYATTTDLANALKEAPPLTAQKLLERASELLDSDFLLTAIYDVDDEGMPTHPLVIKGFRDAVCAQVEFWEEVGEETDISGPLQGAQIGSVNLQFGAGDNRSGPSYYAPKLLRALQLIPSKHIRFTGLAGC
ncbi:hypothetical protein [Streptomyces sp. IB2014 016-6]|uniref:hypothetical protein n=1 Tax=Streptomyces sp. IB2014 016-6 TaxID=2517818 RepID=UPI0011CA73A9|nr:hypothetical protein [Streptomyces sp. IB2014 016-6]TXL91583.1 hypothetical protein EW053_04455 [Streptomyces sp. IB2014 016-6]